MNWKQQGSERTHYLYYNSGPVVVVDEARGPAGTGGAITWHLAGGEEVEARRYRLGGSGGSAEVILLPLDDGGRAEALERAGSSSGLDMAYYSTSTLRVATVFLYRPWLRAEVAVKDAKRLELMRVDSRAVNLSLPQQ
jgi:hypothetical protein